MRKAIISGQGVSGPKIGDLIHYKKFGEIHPPVEVDMSRGYTSVTKTGVSPYDKKIRVYDGALQKYNETTKNWVGFGATITDTTYNYDWMFSPTHFYYRDASHIYAIDLVTGVRTTTSTVKPGINIAGYNYVYCLKANVVFSSGYENGKYTLFVWTADLSRLITFVSPATSGQYYVNMVQYNPINGLYFVLHGIKMYSYNAETETLGYIYDLTGIGSDFNGIRLRGAYYNAAFDRFFYYSDASRGIRFIKPGISTTTAYTMYSLPDATNYQLAILFDPELIADNIVFFLTCNTAYDTLYIHAYSTVLDSTVLYSTTNGVLAEIGALIGLSGQVDNTAYLKQIICAYGSENIYGTIVVPFSKKIKI